MLLVYIIVWKYIVRHHYEKNDTKVIPRGKSFGVRQDSNLDLLRDTRPL